MTKQRGHSYEELLKLGERILGEAGIKEAKSDAWYLLSHVADMNRTTYYLQSKEEVKKEIEKDYFRLLERRKERIPVAYLLENMDFMGFSFYVNENVLIPNQDTEVLVEEALSFSEGREVLDLCTGSGCIAISLALLGSPKSVTASDISPLALEVAKKNVIKLLGENEKAVKLIESDCFQNIRGSFGLIVSNPPYISTEVIKTLEPEVKSYEPRLALDGGADGLNFYRKIVENSPFYLQKGGYLLCEIGYDQGKEVSELFRQNRFEEIRVVKDLSRNDRVVMGKWNR